AEHILIGKEFVPESLIYDSDLGRSLIVLGPEIATRKQRNLKSAEIVFPYHLPVGDMCALCLLCFARQQNVSVPAVMRNERYAPHGRRSNSGQVVQPRKQFLVELKESFFLVTGLLWLKRE